MLPTIGVSKDIYDRIFGQLEKLIPGLRDLQPGDYRKSISGGFMDLHLDVLSRTKEELRIALAHNYQQNGDTIADPDMEIRVYLIPGWEKAEALTYQDASVYNEVYPELGKVSPRLKKSLNAFLTQWLKNLKDQGHVLKAAKEAEEDRKDDLHPDSGGVGPFRLEEDDDEDETERAFRKEAEESQKGLDDK